jgi:uncharacterized protein (UPF0276 family)
LDDLVAESGVVDWIEVITEHFLGRPAEMDRILRLAAGRPVVPHGIEMSIGTFGNDAEWHEYIEQLAVLADRLDPPWFSDHLCFTRSESTELAALAPLPRTKEVVEHVVRRARRAQSEVGRPFLLENIAYHFAWGDDFGEAEFLKRVVESADCYILMDLTNLAQNAENHAFSVDEYFAGLPVDRIVQVHLAGGVEGGGVWYDTHSERVPAPVWELFDWLVSTIDLPAAMLERDMNLHRTAEVRDDLLRIRTMMDAVRS